MICQESQGDLCEIEEGERLPSHASQESGPGKEQAYYRHEKVTCNVLYDKLLEDQYGFPDLPNFV